MWEGGISREWTLPRPNKQTGEGRPHAQGLLRTTSACAAAGAFGVRVGALRG